MNDEISTTELVRQFEEKRNADLFAKTESKTEAQNSMAGVNSLVESAFNQAVVHQIKNDMNLQDNMLDTAKVCVETEMQTLATNVDTKHKEAVFNNAKDACESYGFNEKTTPIWAVNFMKIGYSIILAIWLFIGSFTFMPVIFIAKKISVGLKRTWLAVLIALVIYLCVTFVPILVALLQSL